MQNINWLLGPGPYSEGGYGGWKFETPQNCDFHDFY